MANRIFKKGFAKGFSGIDGQMAAIEPDAEGVNRAVNLEMAVGNSLRGRVGCQTSGSNGFFAIFPYKYTRTQDQYDIVYQIPAGAYPNQTTSLATTKTAADGASIEKLIGLNRQVWMLDTMNVTITQTNAGTYTWYTQVSGSAIQFVMTKNGSVIIQTSLNNGITTELSIFNLLSTIDSSSDLAVSNTTRGVCPPFAFIDGSQSSAAGVSLVYGDIYTWTVVNTPHNFLAGDIISWKDSSGGAAGVLKGGIVISTTATTITYVGPQGTLTNNSLLGYMNQAATNFPISTVSSETSGSLIIGFPYWRLIPEGDGSFGRIYESPYDLWSTRTADSFYAPPVAENQAGNLYIAASGRLSEGIGTWTNNLIRLDGVQPTRAGLPPIATATVTNGAGALTGRYRYKAFLRRYDAQGNIWDGPVSSVSTYTAAAESIRINFTIIGYGTNSGFLVRSCYKHTTESPGSGASFYVDDSTAGVGNSAFIQPGDVACLTDNTAQTTGLFTDTGLATVVGVLHRTRCTAYTPLIAVISPTISSIKVEDSSGYQINANTAISAGITVVVVRTTAGGNQYYELGEVPICGMTPNLSLYDNVTDTTLTAKAQYTEITLGKEHDAPPPCTLVCAHQGGLVVARGPQTPNAVAFSTAEGLEYFPTASNSFDVPSTQSGFISAIASDTDDRLAVFKERAYYDIVGDLDNGAFSINVRHEGDFGIASQASLVRVSGGLLGLSKNGIVTIQDGILDPYKFQEFNARLIAQPYQYAWAVAVNDYFNRNYVLSIPQISGEPVSYVVDYSRGDIKIFERSYATKIDQAGGMAMIGDTLYHLSQTTPYGVFRRLIRFDSTNPSPTGDNGDSFIDNTGAISYIYESNPINFGEPGLYKTPIRIRVWSIPNDYVQEGWVPFSVLIETATSPIASYIGGSNPNSTSSTISFTTTNDVSKDVKVKNAKCFFYLIRFTTNTIKTAPFLTGYEIMFAENYNKEDLQP